MKKKTIIILSTILIICICALGGVMLFSQSKKAPGKETESVQATVEVLEETKQTELADNTAKEEAKPKATKEPEVKETPSPTETPKETEAPAATKAPAVTTEPKTTETPVAGEAPKVSEAPKATESPKATEKTQETTKPKETQEPKETEQPKAEATSKPTSEPTPEPTPKPTPEPTPTPTPEPTEAPHEHDWGGEDVLSEATCMSGGYAYNVCTICGERDGGHDIPFLDHDWDEQEVEPGNCASPSVIEITCRGCGLSKRERGSKTDDHDWETVLGDPSIDMTTGEIIPGEPYERCSVCNVRK